MMCSVLYIFQTTVDFTFSISFYITNVFREQIVQQTNKRKHPHKHNRHVMKCQCRQVAADSLCFGANATENVNNRSRKK